MIGQTFFYTPSVDAKIFKKKGVNMRSLKNLFGTFTIFIILFTYSTGWAGTCTVSIQRSCKSGEPCRASESSTSIKNSEEDCLAHARSFCHIHFTEGVSQKKVHAHFDSKPLNNEQNLCQ